VFTKGIYSTTTGSGPPIVLIHALGFDQTMWHELEVELLQTRQIIKIDLRGHGKSATTDSNFSLVDLADDIAQVLDANNTLRADFLGLSLGGMVGQAFALMYPSRLNKLVLACTTSSYGDLGGEIWQARIDAVERGGMSSIAEQAMDRFFGSNFRQINPELVNTAKSAFLQTNPKGYIATCRAIAQLNFSGQLKNIQAKTLVLAGALDVSAPIQMAKLISDEIPEAELIILPNTAHLANKEAPELFNKHVIAFLNGN
jgi:3-oxoadipate enol-lactonase